MPRTVTFSVNDGGSGSAVGSATATVNVTPVNDAPALHNVAASATYPPGTLTPVVLSPGLTISDVDNPTLSGATVTISSATTFLGDQLGVNLPTLGGVFIGTQHFRGLQSGQCDTDPYRDGLAGELRAGA